MMPLDLLDGPGGLSTVVACTGLYDIEMKAGVMMSGGTHQCYNIGARAKAQCAGCDPSEDCMTPGCSANGTNPNWPNGKVCCYMCCPQGYTETYYKEHPEEYSTFLRLESLDYLT
jgi:hypothetical protein